MMHPLAVTLLFVIGAGAVMFSQISDSRPGEVYVLSKYPSNLLSKSIDFLCRVSDECE